MLLEVQAWIRSPVLGWGKWLEPQVIEAVSPEDAVARVRARLEPKSPGRRFRYQTRLAQRG